MVTSSEALQQFSPQASNSTALVGLDGGTNLKDYARIQKGASTSFANITDRLMDTSNTSNLNSPVSSSIDQIGLSRVSNRNQGLVQTIALSTQSNSIDSIVGDNNRPVGDLNDSLLASTASVTQEPSQSQTIASASTSQSADLMTFPTGYMKSIEDYGAKPNDGIDDTAAIQKALDDQRRDANGNSIYDDYFGRPKALYFPAGTYDVSNTLNWIGSSVTLQGQGSGATVIRLRDSASGFDDPANPKAVIKTPDGNTSFRQNIFNMSVNTGYNNPGAIGIDYIANNVGAMRDVTIKSADGKGFAGLAMDRQWPGPCLIKNVEIDGFDYGIRVSSSEYGPTFENITLKNQGVAGIRNVDGSLAIRGLNSTNSVPVIKGTSWAGMVTLLDADLQGGASDVSAIDTAGEVYVRDVTTSGYQSVIKYNGKIVPGTSQTEYATNVYQLFDGPKQSLKLPIKETPEYHDNNMANWGRLELGTLDTGAKDINQLQSVLNSGKSTIYLDFGKYFSYNETELTVPASVRRIIGFSSVVDGESGGINGGGLKFKVEGNSSDAPLIIEGIGYGAKVEHDSSRPLALKDGFYNYTSTADAGELFLEDVNIEPLKIQPNQKVWARQLNNEYGGGAKITNIGGTFWVLGLKTEGTGTVIKAKKGANTEVLGGVIVPARQFSAEEKLKPAFISKNSKTSLIYRQIAYDSSYNYDIQVQETRNGETRKKMSSELPHPVTLFSGF
ncbi:glycosyl hydrolase family 28-related protein [Mastigocladopsis repens]|uniref:glycosyl hydrolase family 28-related protein n=1 Tax=Mastigocladopsis repens TaxID=221287 RepID=UPI0002EF1E2F|nr:glycosyl hydrolase family 28-related protein [Mastigocladopsis repens]